MSRPQVLWVFAVIGAFVLGAVGGSAWTSDRMEANVRERSLLISISKIGLCADALLMLERQNPMQAKLLLEGELWHSMNSALALRFLSRVQKSSFHDRHRPLLQARRYFESQQVNSTVPEDLLDQLEAMVNSEYAHHANDAG